MPLDASTSITIGGIQVWDEGTEEDYQRFARSSGERRLCCAWNDRRNLVAFLMGGSTASGPVTTTTNAQRYPDANFMLADSVHVEGEGVLGVGPNGMVSYQWAHLLVRYAASDATLLTPDIGTLSMTGSSQIIMPSQSEPTFKWLSGGEDLPPEATPGVLVPTIEFTIVRRNLPAIPTTLILSLIDHVNSATFYGAPPGKVLFTTPNTSSRITANGLENIDLAATFIYHPYGHNKFLRPSTGVWEEIVTKTGGAKVHPEGDLNQLFTA